jgi:hypothetical protein
MRIADLDPGVLMTKIEKNVQLKFFFFFDQKLQFTKLEISEKM